jgi:hypothetical protein
VNYADPLGLETTVIIVHEPVGDFFFGGSHIALHISNPNNGLPTIYDPSGSWGVVSRDGEYHRPSSGIFEGGSGSNLDAFIMYETRGNQKVDVFVIFTDSYQEEQILEKMIELGDGWGGACATNVSGALAAIGLIKQEYFPGGVQKQLEKLVAEGRASVRRGVDTSGTKDNPDQYYPLDQLDVTCAGVNY